MMRRLVLFTILLAMLLCGIASAATIAQEGFDYADGAYLAGQNGGIGWAGAWYAHDDDPDTFSAAVAAGSLSYTDSLGNVLPVRDGKAAGTGKKLTLRDISGAPSTGQVWTSVLLQINSADGSLGSNDSAAFNFFDGNGTERCYVAYRQNNVRLLTKDENNNKIVDPPISTPYAPDQTAFVVTLIDHTTNNMYLWLNPDLDAAPAIVDADLTLATGAAYAIDKIRTGLESSEGPDNCLDELRIGTTFDDVVTAPYAGLVGPAPSGTPGVDVDTMLEWSAPTAYPAVTEYRVFFGTSEPNDLEADYGLTELTDGGSPVFTGTTIAPDPSPLDASTTYHWVVDSYEPNTVPIRHPGAHWSFTTKDTLEVDAGENILTTVELAAVPFALQGSVDYGGTSALTVGWEAFEVAVGGGATSKVTFADATDPNTTVTISEAGTYVLKLTATPDGDDSVSDQKEIVVHADACQAKKLTGTWEANYYDINDDCIVNLLDFADLAAAWLDSTALDGALYEPEEDTAEAGAGIFVEWWTDMEEGTPEWIDPNDLIDYPDYPDSPSGNGRVSNQFAASLGLDNYGMRLRGYIVAPATGGYTFCLVSNNNSRMLLSTDATAANAAVVAEVALPAGSGWASGLNQWTIDAATETAPITLTAGQTYYVEVIHKESVGSDLVYVGWKKPGDTEFEVIPGSALKYSLTP